MAKADLTAERLRELLHYNPETGSFTVIRRVYKSKFKVGDRVGSLRPATGYRVVGVDGIPFLEHRLAWLYIHGSFPKFQIDHINGNRSDNRIENLRTATRAENFQNRSAFSEQNPAGVVGAYRSGRKWVAQIKHDKKKFYLGTFDTLEEARDAYALAKTRMHVFNPTLRPAPATS